MDDIDNILAGLDPARIVLDESRQPICDNLVRIITVCGGSQEEGVEEVVGELVRRGAGIKIVAILAACQNNVSTAVG
jgi:hypothetical protein